MENNNVNIKKVPLESFINILVELYNKGVNFVDIEGVSGNEQDIVALAFTKEYMSEEGVKNFEEITDDVTEVNFSKNKLSDEDLNDLI